MASRKTIQIVSLALIRRAILSYLLLQSVLFYIALLISIVILPYTKEKLLSSFNNPLSASLLFALSATSSIILYRAFKTRSVFEKNRFLNASAACALVASYTIQPFAIDYSGGPPLSLFIAYAILIGTSLFVLCATLSNKLYLFIFRNDAGQSYTNGSMSAFSRLALLILQIAFGCFLIILTCAAIFLALIGYLEPSP